MKRRYEILLHPFTCSSIFSCTSVAPSSSIVVLPSPFNLAAGKKMRFSVIPLRDNQFSSALTVVSPPSNLALEGQCLSDHKKQAKQEVFTYFWTEPNMGVPLGGMLTVGCAWPDGAEHGRSCGRDGGCYNGSCYGSVHLEMKYATDM